MHFNPAGFPLETFILEKEHMVGFVLYGIGMQGACRLWDLIHCHYSNVASKTYGGQSTGGFRRAFAALSLKVCSDVFPLCYYDEELSEPRNKT